jgi:hypothetical protein
MLDPKNIDVVDTPVTVIPHVDQTVLDHDRCNKVCIYSYTDYVAIIIHYNIFSITNYQC